MAQLSQVEHDFCSTNVAVAEQALLKHRLWLLERRKSDLLNFDSYEAAFGRTTARLFQLYEFLGDTNRADGFFQEAAQVDYREHQRREVLLIKLYKDDLRERLEHEQRGQTIGWKVAGKAKE